MVSQAIQVLQTEIFKFYFHAKDKYYLLSVFIIWLNPQAGKMKQTLHSDWLLEWARWNRLACLGNPV